MVDRSTETDRIVFEDQELWKDRGEMVPCNGGTMISPTPLVLGPALKFLHLAGHALVPSMTENFLCIDC